MEVKQVEHIPDGGDQNGKGACTKGEHQEAREIRGDKRCNAQVQEP